MYEMNQQTLSVIWSNVLKILEDTVTTPVYRSWLEPLELVAYIEDRAILKAKSEIEKNVVERNHLTLIGQTLQMVFGYEVQPVIVTANEWMRMQAGKTIENAEPTQVSFVNKQIATNMRCSAVSSSNLNPEYTFENFVMGNHNRYAYAACEGVVTNIISGKKTRLYNPVFLHGNVGLGKTHLMHAIGNRVLKYKPEAKILYLSSETFTNDLINAIRNNKNEEFRNKYRHVDVLLIDDIQFISNKEGTQEEFFHTFNALNDANKQIVITSDRPPKDIPKLEERLRSRFSMGLIADIQAPDFETRIAILRQKAQYENVVVPNDVYEYIAGSVTNNVRELEGALTNVLVYAKINNSQVTLHTAKLCLQNIISDNIDQPVTGERIIQAVANFYQMRVEDLQSKRRTKNVVLPRQIAMYLCRELTDLSLPSIGELFGGRDHSTVLHGYEKVAEELKQDVSLQVAIENIKKAIH